MPAVKYFFSSTDKKAVELTGADLSLPLKISLKETHETLTLNDYFHAVEQFLVKTCSKEFLQVLTHILGRPVSDMASIDKIHLFSEKLGAFYHIAAAEVFIKDTVTKFAVSTAFTPTGIECLEHDFQTLTRLREYTGGSCLPRTFFTGRVKVDGTAPDHYFLITLSEWLEQFHEWHFSMDRSSKERHILIWDNNSGPYFLPCRTEEQIFYQIARILTLCFNPCTAEQVCMWHNAAGDFIVRHDNGKMEARLTTIRKYRPLINYDGKSHRDITLHTIFFLLDLTVRISMDRLDGIHEPVWADRKFLKPALTGFLNGMKLMENKGRIRAGTLTNITELLKGLSRRELLTLYGLLEKIYAAENEMDSAFILSNLDRHTKNLHAALIQL